jgi:hypothetical protein
MAMMLLGIIGFYLGIDMPMRRSNPSRGGSIDVEPGPELDFAELFGAVGVFLATATALVSVYVVVSDGMLPAIWVFGIAGLWLAGATMQIVAGVMARMRQQDHDLGRAPLSGTG